MNKKSLLKKMSIVVASAAMMVTALPLTASAYTGFVNGSYPVNANLYVPQDETPLRKFNAYFTSKEMPRKMRLQQIMRLLKLKMMDYI